MSTTADSETNVLAIGGNDYPFHRFEVMGPILEGFLTEVEWVDIELTADRDALHEESLSNYDVLVDYTTRTDLTTRQRDGLFGFVGGGNGYVGLHCAADLSTDADSPQPELEAFIGGAFVDHPDQAELTVEIVDENHPITQGIDDFTVWDEPYRLRWDPSIHVLAQTHHEAFGDMPVAWTKPYGDGRVFYYANGHDERAFKDPSFQRLVERGIAWADRRT